MVLLLFVCGDFLKMVSRAEVELLLKTVCDRSVIPLITFSNHLKIVYRSLKASSDQRGVIVQRKCMQRANFQQRFFWSDFFCIVSTIV